MEGTSLVLPAERKYRNVIWYCAKIHHSIDEIAGNIHIHANVVLWDSPIPAA